MSATTSMSKLGDPPVPGIVTTIGGLEFGSAYLDSSSNFTAISGSYSSPFTSLEKPGKFGGKIPYAGLTKSE